MLENGCRYTIKGEKNSLNLLELAKHYYKSTGILRNTNIFSSEQIIKSVEDRLRKQLNRQDEITADTSKVQVLEYITSQNNTEAYRKIELNEKDRLVPEYNEKNYILNETKNRLRKEGYAIPEQDDLKTVLEKYPNAQKYVDDIKEDISINENTRNLSFGIHDVIKRVIRDDGDITSSTEKRLRAIIEENKDYLEGDVGLWVQKFSDIIESIYEKVTKNGERILTEVILASESQALAQVKGKIDIVTIDSSGRVHIYDIKLSKDLYEDWASEKLLQTDWQLAFYRALLGQYVKVEDATLNIIPIRLGALTEDKKINVNNLMLDTIVPRLSQETGKGLLTTGKLYKVARALIPGITELTYDPDRMKLIESDLQSLFKDYSIKTANTDYDIEVLLDRAVRQHGINLYHEGFEDHRANIRNNRLFIDSKVGNRYKTEKELRDEYRPILEEYIKFVKRTENNNVAQLSQKIISSIDSDGKSIEMLNAKEQLVVNNIVHQYINGDYEVTRGTEELVSLGIILLRNKKYGSYVILNISSHNQNANYNRDLLYRDVDFLKAMVFLNRTVKELDIDFNKVQDIITYNPRENQIHYQDLQRGFDLFKTLMDKEGLTVFLNKRDHLLPLEKKAAIELREAQRYTLDNISISEKSDLKPILDKYSEQIDNLSITRLKALQSDLINKFPRLQEMSLSSGFNFKDGIEYLFGMVQTLLLIKSEQIPVGDFTGLNNFNINFSSFYDLFAGVLTNNKPVYDKNNKKILSIMDGLKMITPDKIGSKDLQNINIMISGTNSFIGQSFYKQSTVISGLTRKFYEDINYTTWEQNWVGDHRKKFSNFWVKDAKGNISSEWRVKNPYSDSMEDAMTEPERKYLKSLLFEMNKRKLKISSKEIAKANISTLDAMEKSMPEAFQLIIKSIEDKDYFRMPLVRSQQVDRHVNAMRRGWANIKDVYGTEMLDMIDDRGLEPGEHVALKEKLGYYEMYNIYDKQTPKFKEKAIEAKGVENFELDLDALAHRLTFNQIRKYHLDNILPIINAYTWWMKLQAGKRNEDISKELEYVKNRIKLGSMDEPIIDPEAEDVVKAASVVKKITTAGMLAFRPALFMKEMTIGLYKGAALAMTKIYGGEQFGLKDLASALGKLVTIDKKFAKEWNLIDGLNNEYRFANRDVNSLAYKLQTNRRGIFMGLGPWMYSMNTVPDYYNRLALFMAKMIHDGSYDAHSMDENGHLLYDPTKDKRFDYYFKTRNKYKAPEGSNVLYASSKTDQLYNTQRNMYNLLMSELNAERKRAGFEIFEEGDIIDKAYSELERSSYKSFVDTVYGYYDVDSQAEWHKTWYGVLYLQFLQFWPGKMNMWFGSSKKGEVSPMGRHEQASKLVDGKKVLLWRKEITDPDTGKIIGFDTTTENTGDPLLEWIGTPQEGLAMSIMLTLKDAVTGNWASIKDNDLRNRRALYGLSDGALMLLIFALMAKLLEGIIAENGTGGIDGGTLKFIDSVNRKILNESKLMDNTFGALRSEPAFWTYSQRLMGDMWDVMQGDKAGKQVLAKNFRAFEMLEE